MFDRELHSHISSLRDYMPIELQNRKKTRNPFNLRWLNRLKIDDIHQKYDDFKNITFKALEHL